MHDNYNYPPGADNEYAPWNIEDNPSTEFEVTISQTISKTTIVSTNDYIKGGYFAEREWDGDGYCTLTCVEPDDTSNTDWEKAYREYNKTPLELIKLLKDILEGKIDIDSINKPSKEILIEDCSNWVEDELIICEN